MAKDERPAEIKKALGQLNSMMRKIGRSLGPQTFDVERGLADFAKLERAVGDLGKALELGEGTTDMASFFDTVSESLIDAQKSLDVRSRDYQATAAGQPGIQPSTFRIPRLEAELQFAFEKIRGTKATVFFFGKKQEERALLQQSVKFEVVAAPMPEEPAKLPRLGLVLDVAVREAVREVVEDDSRPISQTRKDDLLAHWDQALVVGTSVPNGYMVLLSVGPDPDEPKDLNIWCVELEPAALWVVYMGTQTGEKQGATLRRFLTTLGKTQQEWLNP